jgi:uncharacterized protein with NRDE domain
LPPTGTSGSTAPPPHQAHGRASASSPPAISSPGGTWLGVAPGGLFVGVTNRFGVPKDDARESRGTLVVEALRLGSARAVHSALAPLSAGRFNAFHLLYADRETAFVTWSDGTRVTHDELTPGVHVVTERSLGASDAGRTEWIKARWSSMRTDAPDVAALEAMMTVHGAKSPIEGTCIHLPDALLGAPPRAQPFGYGTRSSAIIVVRDTPPSTSMEFADGSPCTTPYAEVSVPW